MKKILAIAALIMLSYSCINKENDSGYNPDQYEETKMTLEEQERNSPLKFVDIDFKYRKNVWNTFVIQGTITNNATIATYKNPVIRFSFYSKTGRHLGNQDKIWDEYLAPGQSLEVEFREANMSNAKEVRANLINVKPK
jgi:hypothetical protein